MNDAEDECDKWFYDLGKLAETVESNAAHAEAAQRKAEAAQRKADNARRRLMVLAGFTLLAFLLLAYRSEEGARRINANAKRISNTQQVTCMSGLEILIKFNRQQDVLIGIEKTNQFINDKVRQARITAYKDARIEPLPICEKR